MKLKCLLLLLTIIFSAIDSLASYEATVLSGSSGAMLFDHIKGTATISNFGDDYNREKAQKEAQVYNQLRKKAQEQAQEYSQSSSGLYSPGQYNISFDLGLPENMYNVSISDPKRTADGTIQFLRIENKSTGHLLIMALQEYDQYQLYKATPGSATGINIMKNAYPDVSNFAPVYIDGMEGVIGMVKGKIKYIAFYSPNPYLNVLIESTYPWDKGTLSFLNTLHIEKIGVN